MHGQDMRNEHMDAAEKDDMMTKNDHQEMIITKVNETELHHSEDV